MAWTTYTDFNGTTLLDLFNHNNDALNGWFGIGILLSFFLVMYVVMSARRPDISLPISLFVTDIVAFMMVPLDLVDITVPVLIMIAFAASFILTYRSGQNGV